MDGSNFLVFGLKAGGLLWCLTGLAVFLPLFAEFALPLWGRPGKLHGFAARSLLALLCATLPGGSLLAAAAILKTRGDEFLAPAALAEPCPVVVPSGATLPEGCR